jgi:hypothetical protein
LFTEKASCPVDPPVDGDAGRGPIADLVSHSSFPQDGTVVRAVSYRLFCAALLGFGATAMPSTARCGEITAQLDYQAATGCPLASELEALVVRRLGRDPFRSDATESVVVRIELSGSELVGRFEWKDASGRWLGDRVFSSRSKDCRELVRVMGFTLALQFQLMATDAAPEAHATDVPEPAPAKPLEPSEPATRAAPLPPTAVVPATPPASAPSGPSFAIGGGASVGIGLAPSAIALGRVFGTLAWSRVALELGVELSVPSSLHRSTGDGFSEQLLFGTGAACAKGSVLSACLLTKLGEIRVSGEGVEQPLAASGVLLQSGVRVGVAHSLGPHAEIAAHAGGVAQITHAVVTLSSMPIWSAPRVAGDLGADIAVRF